MKVWQDRGFQGERTTELSRIMAGYVTSDHCTVLCSGLVRRNEGPIGVRQDVGSVTGC